MGNSRSGTGCAANLESLGASQGQQGMGVQAHLQHSWSKDWCQDQSPHAAPEARGMGCLSGGAMRGWSKQLQPLTDPNFWKIRVRWIFNLDAYTPQRSAFEPATHTSFVVPGKKQRLPGSCNICSEGVLSKREISGPEDTRVSPLPQEESQHRLLCGRMGQMNTAWCICKSQNKNEHRWKKHTGI